MRRLNNPSEPSWPPQPQSAFRVDRSKNGYDLDFETLSNRRDENRIRGRHAVRPGTLASGIVHVEDARRIGEALKGSWDTGQPLFSLACALSMRWWRIRIIGALLLLLSIVGYPSATTFTVIPKSWEFTPDQLNRVTARQLRNAFRTALYEQGAGKIEGWLICFIHGEFDPVAKVYRLHLHGLCSKSMIKVIDRLRKLPNYRAERVLPNGDWSPVYRRVWIRRKPLDNLAAAVSYLLQSFWPSRPIYISAEGKRRRVRGKQRMREPHHTQVLLWLDRQRLDDMMLRIGLRRDRRAGFKFTHRAS